MVDLRKCKRGDKLVTKRGDILVYLNMAFDELEYPHSVQYPDGEIGSRSHDGKIELRWISELDIVAVMDDPNNNEIEQISVFKTKDGQHFDTEAEARAHAKDLQFNEAYASVSPFSIFGHKVAAEYLRKWLMKNKQMVLDFLT